jgi:hypothetical protein
MRTSGKAAYGPNRATRMSRRWLPARSQRSQSIRTTVEENSANHHEPFRGAEAHAFVSESTLAITSTLPISKCKRGVSRGGSPPQIARELAMTFGALRVSAIALGVAALVSSSPLSEANAAMVVHHTSHGVHRHVAHAYGRHYVHHYGHRYGWRHGHRYAYGYNPGSAVAAGVIGGALGAAAYPYPCDYYYGSYGSCGYGDYGYGDYYGPYYGGFSYGFGPGFFGHRHGFNGHGFGFGHAFHGGEGRFVGGNFGHTGGFAGGTFGHMGGFGGHMGGFGGHMGGFGGHMGGFGGHMGGGGHFMR